MPTPKPPVASIRKVYATFDDLLAAWPKIRDWYRHEYGLDAFEAMDDDIYDMVDAWRTIVHKLDGKRRTDQCKDITNEPVPPVDGEAG